MTTYEPSRCSSSRETDRDKMDSSVRTGDLKVLCSDCGTVEKYVKDRIAASLVEEDHQRECEGETEVAPMADQDAPDTVVLEDGDEHCPECGAFAGTSSESCGGCGAAFHREGA